MIPSPSDAMSTRGEKIRATKQRKKVAFKTQTIDCGKGWTIERFDAMNWTIKHNGEWPDNRRTYYGTLESALRTLPATMLHQEAQGGINDIHRSQLAIQEAIIKTLDRLEARHGQ